MPRRSTNSSDASPVTRRTSARIAAAQVASPAKSPAKSPRRKRRSNEPAKAVSDDTESQQSQVKSDISIEELNGIEVNSPKDRDSTADSLEIPHKKAKVVDEHVSYKPEHSENESANQLTDENAIEKNEKLSTPNDFEVVEHSSVPHPESAEVQAAISVQGEDGQLLVGFVQVDKEELPAANSLEIKQITANLGTENQTTKCSLDGVPVTEPTIEPSVHNVNGSLDPQAHEGKNCNLIHSLNVGDTVQTNGSIETETHHKVLPSLEDSASQPVITPAGGDITSVASEVVSQ